MLLFKFISLLAFLGIIIIMFFSVTNNSGYLTVLLVFLTLLVSFVKQIIFLLMFLNNLILKLD